MTRTRILIPILLMVTIAFISSPANATPLLPGGSVVASSFVGSPGTLLALTSAHFVSSLGIGDFSGTATEGVYLDSITGTTMDFVYQFTNVPAGTKPIEQMSDSSYDSFMTDVAQSQVGFGPFVGGGTLSTMVDRSALGGNIAWKGSLLTTPSTSAILMIKTDATSFFPGTVSFINSGTVTLTGFYAPARSVTPAPEPRFDGLVAAGLIGFVWVSRKRKVSQPTNLSSFNFVFRAPTAHCG
jgi:hypothetical protein